MEKYATICNFIMMIKFPCPSCVMPKFAIESNVEPSMAKQLNKMLKKTIYKVMQREGS